MANSPATRRLVTEAAQADKLAEIAGLEVIGEFPYVHAVDLEPGWNAAMVGSLDAAGFHPNDYGMKHHADRYVEGINTVLTGPVDGVMVL